MRRPDPDLDPWDAPDVRVNRISKWTCYVREDIETPEDGIARGRSVSIEQAFYPHLLAEDVALLTFPVSGMVRDGRDAVQLSPADARAERLIARSLVEATHGGLRGYHDLAHTFAEWGNQCASELVLHGRAAYEIAPIVRGAQSEMVAFALMPLRADEVVECRGRVYQRIRQGAVGETTSLTGEIPAIPPGDVLLPAERVMLIRLPSEYTSIPRAMPILAVMGSAWLPSFAYPNAQLTAAQRVPFNFEVYNRTEKASVAELTRDIGWSARSQFADWQTEYYEAWRVLRFERFKAHLRQVIVRAYNDLLKKLGPSLGMEVALRLVDLPSQSDYDIAIKNLERGTEGPAAVIKRLLAL